MTDDRLADALRSMRPEADPTATEQALAEVNHHSRIRHRHQNRVRAAIGAAAALSVIFGGVALANMGDDGQTVIAGEPTSTTSSTSTSTSTSTTLAPWIVTTSIPDQGPAPQTPPPLRDDQFDEVVGVELRTWYFDDQADGFWTATPTQVEAVVNALAAGNEPFPRPELIDHAYVRFALTDGGYALLEMDVESGWIEPDRRLPEDLTRQMRDGLNEMVGHPWEDLELGDDNPYLQGIIDLAQPPWQSPEHAFRSIYEAFDLHDVDARGLFGEIHYYEGHGPFVLIKARGGDDSTRGVDYRFALVERPGGWEIGGGRRRALCLRSPSFWSDDAELWSCL